jgi:hypothetical protein
MSKFEESSLVSILPPYSQPKSLLVSDTLPFHGHSMKAMPISSILQMLNRKVWSEGLYAQNIELDQIPRYLDSANSFKHDFTENDYLRWVKIVEENTAICDMGNADVGKGVFVPPGKVLPKGTFIPSSGIIKLHPTKHEMETKSHCSALQNYNTRSKKIVGIINPEIVGGILDLINHAPSEQDLDNFIFINSPIRNIAATANLISTIRFYNGFTIMGLIAPKDIHGGNFGKQLLWSYAQSCEYVHDPVNQKNKNLVLFDNRLESNGSIIDSKHYSIKYIDIFIDTGEPIVKKVASLSRWELMETSPKSRLNIAIEDPYSSNQSETIQSPLTYGDLQAFLENNPVADRIIIEIPD